MCLLNQTETVKYGERNKQYAIIILIPFNLQPNKSY